MRIKDEIIGKEVVDINAIVIGKVKDVDVDFETQTFEAFIVGKGGISLRASDSEIVIPYEKVKTIGDKVLLKGTLE